MINMVFGTASRHDRGGRDGKLAVPIVVVAAGLLLVLGVWMPPPFYHALSSAAAVLAVRP